MGTSVAFGGGAKALDFEVSGTVQISPVAVAPAGVTLYVAVADPKIVSHMRTDQAEFDRIAQQIKASGTFFVLSAGKVAEMRTPRGFSETTANVYRAVASALQFAHATGDADSYTDEEYDTTGRYVASYSLDRGNGVWHKTKQKYLSLLGNDASSVNAPRRIVPHVVQSTGPIQLLPDDRLKSIEMVDAVDIEGAQAPVHSTTSISLVAAPAPQRSPKASPDWPALIASMQSTPADRPYGAARSIEALDKARINGLTFDRATKILAEIAKTKRAMLSGVNGTELDAQEKADREKVLGDQSKAFTALAAILREQPETIPLAVQKIKSQAPEADFLIEALGAAATPASERALISLSEVPSLGATRKSRVLMALSRTPRPSEDAIASLEGKLKADPYNELAMLGLGTYSRHLRDEGSAQEAVHIGDLLVDHLKSARQTTEILTSLRAITNSGYSPALPSVLPYVTDGREVVRVAAVRAFQAMDDPRVDGIIAGQLASTRGQDVEISALNAAKVRQPTDTLAHAVETTAASDQDPRVRYHAVELLTSWLGRRPDVRPILEKVASNDAETRIRELAQGAL
jgi:hypothetical protein